MGAMQNDLGVLDTYQPTKFKMVTELQGGWFSQVGGQLSEAQGFDASHINHVTLFAWEKGFTSTNYYMGFGGTNFGDWAASSITTTYDYDAPVRENGGMTERYFAVKALGDFIAEHGAQLSRTTLEKAQSKTDDRAVIVTVRRATDGSRFVFVRTEQRRGSHQGTIAITTPDANPVEITANYELGNYGAKVLYLPPGATKDSDGQWYPKAIEMPKRPTELPKAVTITEARMQPDSVPTKWQSIDPGKGEESAGIYDRRFVFYRAVVPALQASAGGANCFLGASGWARLGWIYIKRALAGDGFQPWKLHAGSIGRRV